MLRFYITLVSSLLISSNALQAQPLKIDSLETSLRAAPNNIEIKYELALRYHALVQKQENSEALKRAERLLTEILETKPDHVAALVYYGSLLTLKGRDALLPWNKLKYVERGCDKMDKAVQIDPQNINTRIVRAMNNINLPDFFNRLPYCLEDFDFIKASPEFSHLNPATQQRIYYYSGQALEKDGQVAKAIDCYKKAIGVSEDKTVATEAALALKELTE